MVKIQSTRNHQLFSKDSGENRPLNIKTHKRLEASMRKYGFLPCFPIIVVRDKNGKLIIRDGQHRFAIAESLGFPIYYVEYPSDFDLAEINSTSCTWKLSDYAQKYADSDVKAYLEGMEFVERHKLPIGIAFALLSGAHSYGDVREQFISGKFKVRDKEWAELVASLYTSLVSMSKQVKNTRLLEACMEVCRVPEFDPGRLLRGAKRCHDMLVGHSGKDGYLDMLEEIYNFGQRQSFGLKAAASNAKRERRVVKSGGQKPTNPSNHKSAN